MHVVSHLRMVPAASQMASMGRTPTYEGQASNHGAVVLAGQDLIAGHHFPISLVNPLAVPSLALLGRLVLPLETQDNTINFPYVSIAMIIKLWWSQHLLSSE